MLEFKDVFGREAGATMKSFPFDNTKRPTQEITMPNENRKYKAACILVEQGVRHLSGDFLKLEISEERAKALINAGLIIETQPEVKKDLQAPENRMISAPEEKKDADLSASESTGKGAALLGRKRNKK